jgi:hypothetical protein
MTTIPLNQLARPEPRRDQWGRYKVVPPGGGKPQGYTRVTTVAKSLDTGGGLANWKGAMTAIGIIKSRALRARWEALLAESGGDPWYGGDEHKAACKTLVTESATAGGADDRRETGSALHSISAIFDGGGVPEHLTDETRRDLAAYKAGLDNAHVTIDPAYIETTVILDKHKVAGTFDRLAHVPGYDLPLIADLKTGASLDYSWQPIAVQLAAYARADHVYVQGADPDGSEDQRLPMPAVEQHVGLILWLNAGSGMLDLFLVDLDAGWRAFDVSLWARGWRQSQPFKPLSVLETQLAASLDARQQPPEAPESPAEPPGADRPEPPYEALQQAEAWLWVELLAWLQKRIDTIGQHPRARMDLVARWPANTPPPRDGLSEEQFGVVAALVEQVEGRHKMAFPDPEPQMPQTEDARVLRLFPTNNNQQTGDSA